MELCAMHSWRSFGKKQKKGMTKNDERLQILAHTEKIQNLSLRWRVRALRERIQTETKGGTAVPAINLS